MNCCLRCFRKGRSSGTGRTRSGNLRCVADRTGILRKQIILRRQNRTGRSGTAGIWMIGTCLLFWCMAAVTGSQTRPCRGSSSGRRKDLLSVCKKNTVSHVRKHQGCEGLLCARRSGDVGGSPAAIIRRSVRLSSRTGSGGRRSGGWPGPRGGACFARAEPAKRPRSVFKGGWP